MLWRRWRRDLKVYVQSAGSLAPTMSEGRYVFSIPGYQRPYSWTTEQAQELLDDLTGFMRDRSDPVAEMPPYFLGSIVLIKRTDSPMAEVIDGQQRLTTLTLLLSAIRYKCVICGKPIESMAAREG